jgi:3D (Asp-Asp-Asp) domain-containing protein
MANGAEVHHGAVAVDPRIIPMGSHLRIPGYGRGRATDTGSAIRGYRIDVWMSSCFAARMWGARLIRIRVFK